MTNFSELLRRLADAGLDFVILGGYAATAHEAQHVTWDLIRCTQTLGRRKDLLVARELRVVTAKRDKQHQ